MKKFFVVLVALAVTASIAHAQLNFGARAGFNLTNMSWKYDGKDVDLFAEILSGITGNNVEISQKFRPGFQIGLVADYALTDAISIQPGILFAQQGYKVNESIDFMGQKIDFKASINLNYIQIPINVQYKMDMGGMNLILQAGPYLGFGLGGKMKFEASGQSEEEDIKFGSGDEHMLKPLDLGLGLGAGLQFGAIQVGLGYNLGLANIVNDDDSKFKVKNNGLALTLTYVFGY